MKIRDIMKLKMFIRKLKFEYYKKDSFIKKFKISLLMLIVLFLSMFLKSWNNYDIINVGITSISILFGFALSFFLTIYSNENLNKKFKKKNMFDKFINDNKKYLNFLLGSIVFMYIVSLTTSFEKVIYIDYIGIKIYLSTVPLVFVSGILCFLKTFDFVDKYIIVYQNTYSDKFK